MLWVEYAYKGEETLLIKRDSLLARILLFIAIIIGALVLEFLWIVFFGIDI